MMRGLGSRLRSAWKHQANRSILRSACVAIGAYWLLVAISLFSSNPFTDGVDAVAAVGGWDPDQVRFRGGSYGYRFFYAVAEVDVTVETARGPVPVHLEMSKIPIAGWSVNRFEITS